MSFQGIHHHVHFFFRRLHLLCHAQHANFQLEGTTSILLISSTNSIAFLLVIPFLVIIHQGMIVVTFVPILSALDHFVALLSFQLVVLLSEQFNRCGKGLYLPLQYAWRVPGLLVGSGH